MTATHAQTTSVAARADDVWKVYGSGEAQVTALRGVSVELRRAEFTAIMGPSGSGKSTLMHCLAGLDTVTRGEVYVGDTQTHRPVRRGAHQAAPRPGRLHLPAVQPAADADRRGEHPAAAGDRRPQAGPGLVRHASSTPSACATGSSHRPDPALRRPAAAGRVRPGAGVPARGHLRRRADRQPRLPLRRRGARLPAQLGHASSARPSSWSPTTRTPPSYADRVIFLADGAIVTELRAPTADAVLDTMKRLDSIRRSERLMLRATLKSLLSRKLRLILSGLAVVLGVMFVSGSFVLTNTLGELVRQPVRQRVLAHATSRSPAKPKLADAAGARTTTAPTVPATRGRPDHARCRASPSATGLVHADGAHVIGPNGKVLVTAGAPRFGINWTGTSRIGSISDGPGTAAPTTRSSSTTASPSRATFTVGDQVGVVRLRRRKHTYTLVGIFGYSGGRDSLGGEQTVAFTTPVAQQLMLGTTRACSPPSTSRPTAGVTDDAAARPRWPPTLGRDYRVKTGKQLADESTATLRQGAVVLQQHPARLRRRRAVRRHLPDPEHVLDHRGPAHARNSRCCGRSAAAASR